MLQTLMCANAAEDLCLQYVHHFELRHWQLRRVDHNGSHNRVFILSPPVVLHITATQCLAYFMRILNSCAVYQVSNCQTWVCSIPVAYILCSAAIRRDIRAA